MVAHPVKAVWANGSAVAKGDIRSYIMARTSLVLVSAAEITSMDVDQAISVTLSGRVYYYDSTDTTTAHDGLNVLVDSTGRRFKLTTNVALASGVYRVLTKGSNSTPGSPSSGDVHIVGPAPTGSWASHANTIAVYVGSWVYITPIAGAVVFNVADSKYYSFDGSAWVDGLPSDLPAASVKLSKMLNGVIPLIVNGTAADEAGTESDGDAWIVSSSPSGAFSTFSPKSIVILEDGAWVEYPPSEGWRVDDKSSGNELRYSSANEWITASSPSKVVRVWQSSGSVAFAGISIVTAFTQTITRSAAGNVLIFDFSCNGTANTTDTMQIYKDADGSPLAAMTYAAISNRMTYSYTMPDANSHDYKFKTRNTVDANGHYSVTIWEVIP